MTKVEEVARTIFRTMFAFNEDPAIIEAKWNEWDDERRRSMRYARAAIEALLEPSEAMIAAADRQAEANKSLERGYVDGTYLVLRAAITAALGETDE